MTKRIFKNKYSLVTLEGFVMVYTAFLLLVLLAITGLAIDVGNAFYQRKRIQNGADAGTLAALNVLSGASYSTMCTEASTMAALNGVATNELTAIECGQWNAGTFTKQGWGTCASYQGSCNNSSTNAVKIRGTRNVPAKFGGVVGVFSLVPSVESIAVRNPGGACVPPFGLEYSYLIANGVQVGQTFIVSSQASGNWGKINVGGEINGNNDFINAMANPPCDPNAQIGGNIPVIPGVAGVRSAFLGLLNDQTPPFGWENIIMSLVEDFDPGCSSGCEVGILEFMKVNLESITGNGQNWVATFRLIELPTVPPQPPGAGDRVLVK